MTRTLIALPLLAGSLLCQNATAALMVSTDGCTAENAAQALLGAGLSYVSGSATCNLGATTAAGFFTGGDSIDLGIESGIVLTSGDASDAPGPNSSDSISTDWDRPGLSELDALIPGYATQDAMYLEFDFTSETGAFYLQYVFASDEYNEWVGSSYNDVFGFFLDDENLALVPGTGVPVSINTVNNVSNSAFYRDNDYSDFTSPYPYDIEYDGLTTVLTATKLNLSAGEHTIKLAIADAGDGIYDSAVFLKEGGITGFNPAPVPGTLALLGLGLAGISYQRRRKSD